MGYEDIMVGGKSLNQWETDYSEGVETPELKDEDVINLGIIRPEERTEEPNKFYGTLDQLGIEHPEESKEYQKLTVGETFKDIGQTKGLPLKIKMNYQNHLWCFVIIYTMFCFYYCNYINTNLLTAESAYKYLINNTDKYNDILFKKANTQYDSTGERLQYGLDHKLVYDGYIKDKKLILVDD